MKTYSISFIYSRNGGSSWTSTSTHVKAETESSAIAQLKSKYPYIKNIRVMSVR